MQEVSYYLVIVFSIGLHKKKKAPWPTLPLHIILYKIKSLKDSDVEANYIVNFELGTKEFNCYDPHGICKDHFTRIFFLWNH